MEADSLILGGASVQYGGCRDNRAACRRVLIERTIGGMSVSTSPQTGHGGRRPRPPWLAFLLEPAFGLIDQLHAEVERLGDQLQDLPPEHLRNLQAKPERDHHPEDEAWLLSEQRRLQGLRDAALKEALTALTERVGTSAANRIIRGQDPAVVLRDVGIVMDDDLQALIDRARGYLGGES